MEQERATARGAPVEPRIAHREGSRVAGRYRLDVRLAATGMSAVWRATDERLGRPVVVKLMALDLAAEPEARGRFEREARAAGQLTSPNIVTVFDYGDSEDVPFMVLELLEGEDLQQRLARVTRLPPHACLRIAEQTAAGLAVAHEAGLVHRDIKPSNLFLARSAGAEGEMVKVLDFGIAKLMTESRRTASGTLVGSPLYMSPEQALQRPIGPATDLYSLGVVLYRCLTGDVPFRGPLAEVLVALVQRAPAPPSAVHPALGVHFDAFFARALAKDPAHREPDVRSFMVALRTAIAAHDAALAPAALSAPGGAPSITAATARPSGPGHEPVPGGGDADTSVFQAVRAPRAPLPRTLVSATPEARATTPGAPSMPVGPAFDEDAAATAMMIPREVVEWVRAAAPTGPQPPSPTPKLSPRTVPLRAPSPAPAAIPAPVPEGSGEDATTSALPEALVRHMRSVPGPSSPHLSSHAPAPTSVLAIPEQTVADLRLAGMSSPTGDATRPPAPSAPVASWWVIASAIAVALVLAVVTFVLLTGST